VEAPRLGRAAVRVDRVPDAPVVLRQRLVPPSRAVQGVAQALAADEVVLSQLLDCSLDARDGRRARELALEGPVECQRGHVDRELPPDLTATSQEQERLAVAPAPGQLARGADRVELDHHRLAHQQLDEGLVGRIRPAEDRPAVACGCRHRDKDLLVLALGEWHRLRHVVRVEGGVVVARVGGGDAGAREQDRQQPAEDTETGFHAQYRAYTANAAE